VKTRRILSLDVGGCTLKLAVVHREEAHPRVVQVRLSEVPAGSDAGVRSQALKALLEGIPLEQMDEIVTVVDDPFLCLRQVVVPQIPAKEMNDAVRWELQRFLAIPPEETAVDYEVLQGLGGEGIRKQKLLVVAVPAAAIQRDLDFLSQVGLRPTQMMPKCAALQRWLGAVRPGEHAEPVGILEIGGSACELMVMEAGRVVFSRKFPGGGAEITRDMTGVLMAEQGQVALTHAEAETIKRSVGIPAAEAASLGAKGISGTQLFSLIRGSLERLVVETERSLAFYAESAAGAAVGELVLVGGGAHLKGLAEWIGERLGLRISVMPPLEGLAEVPGALGGAAAGMPLALAPVLGAALGAGKGFNLLPIELQERIRVQVQKAALKAALTAAALTALLLWAGLHLGRISLRRQIEAFQMERRVVSDQLREMRIAVSAHRRLEREPDWEATFRELTYQVPREVYLTELTLEGSGVVIHGRVRRLGSPPEEVLRRFLDELEKGRFTQVALRSSRQVEAGAEASEFEIGCRLPGEVP